MLHKLHLWAILWLLVIHYVNSEVILKLDFNQSVNVPVTQSEDMKNLIHKLLHDSEGIPLKCRRDYCKLEVTHDEYKGTLQWDSTPVGSRRLQRCPYAFEEDQQIAYYECLPGRENKRSDWLNLNMTLCPDTPLTEALRLIYDKQLVWQGSQNTTLAPLDPTTDLAPNSTVLLLKSAHHLDYTMKKHSHIPMLSTEWLQVYKLMLESPIKSTKKLSNRDCKVIYSIWDALVGNVHDVITGDLNETSTYNDLPDIYSTVCMRSSYLGFLTALPVSLSHESSSVEALQWSRDESESRDVALSMIFSTMTELTTEVVVTLPEQCEVCDLAVVAFREQTLVNKRLTFDALPDHHSSGHADKRKRQYFHHGPVIFTEIHNKNGTDLSEGEMTIEVDFPKENVPSYADQSLVVCGYSSFRRPETIGSDSHISKDDYSPTDCITRGNTKNHVSCICVVPATAGSLVTLFYARDESYIAPRVRSNPSDVGVFLRFPYKYDLTVTGYVLKGLSTICLLLTLLSYGLFRKAHRGVLTKILLHLVVAMLCVNVMFFVSIFMTGQYMGCRIANALRLYFVLASLMWNGVEAVNMYLLLIQVFNSTVEHFILKAGILAWGIPILPVAASLIADKHSFDGEWVNCNFVCSLPQMTLYFAFLLPLAVIMFFNLTIFALVLRVILSKHDATPTKETGRNRMVQLSGAVAMMVLLGVPWIFGVFGVIEDDSNDELALTQLIFHIIFILGLNLQGIFIFWFHCLRIKEISASWKMKLSSLSFVLKPFRSHDSYSTSASSLRAPTASSSM